MASGMIFHYVIFNYTLDEHLREVQMYVTVSVKSSLIHTYKFTSLEFHNYPYIGKTLITQFTGQVCRTKLIS